MAGTRGRRRRGGPRSLAPLLRERWELLWRGRGFGRTLLLRRAAATVLVVLAAVLALTPPDGSSAGVGVLVAARDLPPGAVLDTAAVQVRSLPASAVPDGVLHAAPDAAGRTLAAPLRRGEPVTDVRLAGGDLARVAADDPDAVGVPLRLADPGVAALLHPGARVDVVGLGERDGAPTVLARDAQVLTVLDHEAAGAVGGPGAEGRLVLVALGTGAATRVAASSLSGSLTVTVR